MPKRLCPNCNGSGCPGIACINSYESFIRAVFQAKYPNVGAFHSGSFCRPEALARAKALRASGVYATIWHINGPRTGKRSQYVIATI